MHVAVFRVLYPIHPRAAERLGRQYVLAFQGPVLNVLRSGPHRGASLHAEEFTSHQELLLNVLQKIKRRFYNGYALVWWSEGFPLLPWMQAHAHPIKRQDLILPGIQLKLPLDK